MTDLDLAALDALFANRHDNPMAWEQATVALVNAYPALREEREKAITLRQRAYLADVGEENCDHSTACLIWGDDGQGHTAEGWETRRRAGLHCNCGALLNWERRHAMAREQQIESLTAELASLRARVRASKWQEIETAPKDGNYVLLYACEYKRHWFGRGYYFKGVPGDGEGWVAHSFYTMPVNDSSGTFTPTHWMPLPAPPTVPAQETKP